MTPLRRSGIIALSVALAGASSASAQVPRVITGWGVDTLNAAWTDLGWQRAVPEIFRAWRDYLLAQPQRQAPTEHWSASEQRDWRFYDLAGAIAYKGFAATVLDIRPARAGNHDEFVVKTLFANATGDERDIRPIALTRVYAIRENDRWVFANALPRLTRDWRRVTVGAATYVVAPGVAFDRNRAARALAFADSFATTLGLPRIERLTYYVAGNSEELHRAMGVDWTFGAQGQGYALPWNHMVLSGNPRFGEDNLHELIHFVLSPLTAPGRAHGLVNEGIATWLGGSAGRTYAELRAEYADYLRAHPDVTLDTIIEGDSPDRGFYPAGSILMHMVHDRAGVSAFRELLNSGRSHEELRAALSRILGVSWQEVAEQWRRRALQSPVAGR